MTKKTELTFERKLTLRRNTNQIIIHHQAGSAVPASTMHQWHLDRGWAGIGYHWVIQPDGTIEAGRPHDVIGSHAKGANANSIGVCFAGHIDLAPPTERQIAAFAELYHTMIKPAYGDLEITGHRDHGATTCPGRHMPMDRIREMVSDEPILMVNRRRIHVPIKLEDGRMYVLLDGKPGERYWVQIRALADLMGGRLQWCQATRTATLEVR